jgi:hypothetical protein
MTAYDEDDQVWLWLLGECGKPETADDYLYDGELPPPPEDLELTRF